MAKPIDTRVVALNSRIFAARLDRRHVLIRAGVPRSTWWRWVKHGWEPKQKTVDKVDDAITAIIAEKEQN